MPTVYADITRYATIVVGARNDGQMYIANQGGNIYMPAVSKTTNSDVKIKLASLTRRVYHNPDGSLKNVVLKAIWPIRANIGGVYRNVVEGSFNTGEINRIPRSSEILSSANFTLENNLQVNLKSYFDEFRHDILLKINGSNFKTITNVDTSTTITFTETEINNLYNQSVNVSELSTELVVTTKHNSNVIGTTTKKGQMIIDPIKNAPDFGDFEFKPDNKTSDVTGWVDYVDIDNGLSIIRNTIYTIKPGVVTPKKGATITGYEVSLNNRIYKASGDEFTLPNAITYNDNLIVYAVDSRGFKTSVLKNIIGVEYAKIIFNELKVERRKHPNQNEINFVVEGKIFKTSAINNQLSSRFRYKEVGSNFGDWTSLTSNFTVQNDGTFSANFNRTGFNSMKAYELEFEVSDVFTKELFQLVINMERPVATLTKNKFKLFGLDMFMWSE